MLLKESELIGALFHNGFYYMLYHILGNFNDIRQLRKCNLRFNMPEFRNMTRCIRVFRSEARSECVNLSECHSGNLSLELSRNGKPCGFAEKVVCIILLGTLVLVGIAYGCYLEHLSGTFTVTARDKRSVYVYITSVLEVPVNCRSKNRTHAEYRVKSICTQTKVRHGTEIVKGMTLLLKRVVKRTIPQQNNIRYIDFNSAVFRNSRHNCTGNLKSRSEFHKISKRISLRKG